MRLTHGQEKSPQRSPVELPRRHPAAQPRKTPVAHKGLSPSRGTFSSMLRGRCRTVRKPGPVSMPQRTVRLLEKPASAQLDPDGEGPPPGLVAPDERLGAGMCCVLSLSKWGHGARHPSGLEGTGPTAGQLERGSERPAGPGRAEAVHRAATQPHAVPRPWQGCRPRPLQKPASPPVGPDPAPRASSAPPRSGTLSLLGLSLLIPSPWPPPLSCLWLGA